MKHAKSLGSGSRVSCVRVMEFVRLARMQFRLSHVSAAVLVFAVLSFQPHHAEADDAAADFSATNNPTGPWSYGWAASLTPGPTGLNLYTNPTSGSGLDGWNDPNNVSLGAPSVARVITNQAYPITQPGQTLFHPGSAGEFSFFRWTAPGAQTFLVTATFTGVDCAGNTTTDVHVLHNGVSLFSGLVNGCNNTASFPAAQVAVLAGDTIDFAVGFGSNGNFFSDATGLAASILPPQPAVISNGDFSQGLTGWTQEIFAGCAGTRTVAVLPSDPPFSQVLELKTINAGSFCGGSTAVYRDLNVPVTPSNSIALTGNVRAISASVVSGCGVSGTEYPAQIILSYLDNTATLRDIRFAFHFSGGTCGSPTGLASTSTFVSVPVAQGQWFSFNSGDITATLPNLTRITRVTLIGNGWDYEGHLDNLNLSQGLVVTPTPPAISSLCSPGVPATLSGSTGAQGVLDPGNAIAADQPEGGLIWPTSAFVFANIFLDTGAVVFTDASDVVLGTATLPGVSGTYPAFPDGRLHFSRVRLPQGRAVTIAANAATAEGFTAFLGKAPAAVVLSCENVILDTGSALSVGPPVTGAFLSAGPVVFPGAFPGGGAATNLPAGGFGPRSGSGAAGGVIYPPMGGAGGGSGSAVVDCGLGVDCPSGGFGGGALVIAAAQRVRIDGTIYAVGSNAVSGNPGAQGGGGGSVRIAGTLVEGNGVINTSGGSGAVSGASGPIEIQAFVQDAFAGTATGSPVRGNPVAAPLPTNLPRIDIVYVSVAGPGDVCSFDCNNTGSLVAPDVALPAAAAPQTVGVEAQTTGVPLGTPLVFRAVGSDGSVSEATGPVVATTPCTGGQGACVNLTLNPGATYQIVVTPSAAFPLARGPQAAPLRGTVPVTSLREASPEAELAARWARALGADPRRMEAAVARMTVQVGSSE